MQVIEREVGPGAGEIQIIGDLDLGTSELLRESIASAESRYETLLVCLRRCDSIDSAGVSVLVEARERLAGRGHRLALLAPRSS